MAGLYPMGNDEIEFLTSRHRLCHVRFPQLGLRAVGAHTNDANLHQVGAASGGKSAQIHVSSLARILPPSCPSEAIYSRVQRLFDPDAVELERHVPMTAMGKSDARCHGWRSL
jgi:hypothetical protein